MQRKLLHNGDLKVWEVRGNTGDYININIAVDTPIEKIAHINIWVSGNFEISRISGDLPSIPKVERDTPYCSFSRILPFEKVNKGILTFTATQDDSIWYCINHPQYKLLTGESYKLKAGESLSIPGNNYVFVALGEVEGLSAPSIKFLNSDETITAITDCMVLRIDNVQLQV